MKKFIVFFTTSIATCLISVYWFSLTHSSKSQLSGLLLENVEALSVGGDESWGYEKNTGPCPFPCSKRWVSCGNWVIGGDPNCSDSDCC